MASRTTHRSRSRKKLYAKRNAEGEFADIQTYARAHGGDVKRKSAAERKAAGRKKGARRKAARKKGAPKKASRKK